MAKDLVDVLQRIKQRTEKVYPPGKARDKFTKILERLTHEYDGIELQEYHQETYESLIKRGNELVKQDKLKDAKVFQYYLRYCDAALFDFKDNIKPLQWIGRAYMIMCILFVPISVQYYPPILPLVMLVPMFMGFRGIKKRTLTGLQMANLTVPLGFLASITWLQNTRLALGNYAEFIGNLAEVNHISVEVAKSLHGVLTMLSLVLLICSVLTAFFSFKYQKMFV